MACCNDVKIIDTIDLDSPEQQTVSHSSLHTWQLSESINLIISQFGPEEEAEEVRGGEERAQRQLQIDAATCCRYRLCCASSSTSTPYQLSVGDTRLVSNDFH